MAISLTIGYREENDPQPSRLLDVLDRLEEYQGEEGFGVTLTCDATEWSISTFVDGKTVWMNLSHARLGYGEPRHMRGVSREQVLALWSQLRAGRIDEIERQPWQPGHG